MLEHNQFISRVWLSCVLWIKSMCGALPENTTRWPNVGQTLAHRLRRWPNIQPALGEYIDGQQYYTVAPPGDCCFLIQFILGPTFIFI